MAGVGANFAILGFITAVYLAAVIRDERRPQDTIAILGYLLWTVGFALLSLPDRFEVGAWTPVIYGLGALAILLLLPLTWTLYVEYLVE